MKYLTKFNLLKVKYITTKGEVKEAIVRDQENTPLQVYNVRTHHVIPKNRVLQVIDKIGEGVVEIRNKQ